MEGRAPNLSETGFHELPVMNDSPNVRIAGRLSYVKRIKMETIAATSRKAAAREIKPKTGSNRVP